MLSQSLSSTPGRQKKPAEWVKVRKKLPLVLDNPAQEAEPTVTNEPVENATPETDPNETELTPFAADSPFFKVPLPPKETKRAFRLKPRKKAEDPAPSVEPKPSEQKVGGLEDLYENARYLVNWVPRMKSKKMIVEGDILTLTAKKKVKSDDRWFTSRVVDRLRPNLIMTKGGPYVLEGKMNYQAALTLNVPQYIMTAFKNGFPAEWDYFRQEWRRFILQQRENEETISLCSTLQSEQSHFQHVSRTRNPSASSENEEPEKGSNVMKVKVQVHRSADKSNDLSLTETSFEEVVGKQSKKRKSTEFSDDKESAKRKRSRSRSTTKSTVQDDDEDDELVISRPRKNRFKSPSESSKATVKRGRPQKCSKLQESDGVIIMVDGIEVVNTSDTKPRRGRPPKSSEREKADLAKKKQSPNEKKAKKKDTSEKEAKKLAKKRKSIDKVPNDQDSKRGRRNQSKSSERENKRKSVENQDEVSKATKLKEKSEKAKEAPKRRGRPPKNDLKVDSVSVDKNEKSTNSVQDEIEIKDTDIPKEQSRRRSKSKSTDRESKRKSLEHQKVVKDQEEKVTKLTKKKRKSVENQDIGEEKGKPKKAKPTNKKQKSVESQEVTEEESVKAKEAPTRRGRPPKNDLKVDDLTSVDKKDKSTDSVASKTRGRPKKSDNEPPKKMKKSKEPLPLYAAYKPKEIMKENSKQVKKAKKDELKVKDLKSKPKSLKDAKKNEEILKAHNADHEDDLFKSATKKTTKKAVKKVDKAGKRASDILAEIFHDSDSEQNLSLHSAKTPILAFIDRSKSAQPEEDFEEDFEPQ